ncbi:hypothetical protein SAMN05444157_1262 [Frankineae bacterium MT45]|nr:hypothetical protein SAMN05444157_1262 [Frankineae bacterium MT45]
MSQLPRPLRATVGLVFTCVDAVRSSPEKAVEIPMLAVSSALQFSLRAQQRYAEFTVRGDEILGRLRPVPEEPPAWATFDEEVAFETFATDDGNEIVVVEEDLVLVADDDQAAPPAAPPASAAAKAAPRKTPTAKKSAAARKVSSPKTGRPSAFDSVVEPASETAPTAAAKLAAEPAADAADATAAKPADDTAAKPADAAVAKSAEASLAAPEEI